MAQDELARPVLSSFPQDGKRWQVKWIDTIDAGETNSKSPKIQVLLQSKSNSRGATARSEFKIVWVHVGLVPMLVIGDLYIDGVHNGATDAEQHDLTLPIHPEQFPAAVNSPMPRIVSSKPAFLDARPRKLIGAEEYDLGGTQFAGSEVYYWESHGPNGAPVLLPCYEVFRAFMAPSTTFANALTNGPWSENARKIAHPDQSGVGTTEKEWHVLLGPHIKDEHAPWAANLVLTSAGSKAASSIHGEFIVRNEAFSPLRTRIPFDAEELKIRGRFLNIGQTSPKYLCIQIQEVRWPYGGVEIRFARASEGKDTTTAEQQASLATTLAEPGIPMDMDESPAPQVILTSDEEPATNTTVTTVDVPAVTWTEAPVQTKDPTIPGASKARGRPVYEDPDNHGRTRHAAGEAYGTASRSRQTIVAQDQMANVPSRYQALVDVLLALKRKGIVSDLKVARPKGEAAHFRGEYRVWPVPSRPADRASRVHDRRQWVTIHGTHQRTVLALALWYEGLRIAALEIECRPEEKGYRTLFVVLYGSLSFRHVVSHLVRACSVENGRWQQEEVVATLRKLGIHRFKTWVHQYGRRGHRSRKGEIRESSVERALQEAIVATTVKPVHKD